MRRLAAFLLVVLSVAVSAVYLPILYEKLFIVDVEKTHLLFSPVTKRFIYKEKIVGPAPSEVLHKAEDHHSEVAYRDENGTYYSRVEFEKNLPFIYYKNMELWGLLPLRLDGREFGKNEIKANRRVLELKREAVNERGLKEGPWPLLESNPGQARLVFPEDRFRMTADAMEFINADYNKIDDTLTTKFTNALKGAGFTFPARSVNGKFTILKPFDEGVFIVDADYNVFHVKRRNGEPVVVRTPIPASRKTRRIMISENISRKFFGLLLDGNGRPHLLTYDNYALIPLPVENYDPATMDFKLLINPLYTVAVWSDEVVIRAAAMDGDYNTAARYNHVMSRALETTPKKIYGAIFPFTIGPAEASGGIQGIHFQPGNRHALIVMAICLAAYLAFVRIGKKTNPRFARLGLVAVTGIYGLIALAVIGPEV